MGRDASTVDPRTTSEDSGGIGHGSGVLAVPVQLLALRVRSSRCAGGIDTVPSAYVIYRQIIAGGPTPQSVPTGSTTTAWRNGAMLAPFAHWAVEASSAVRRCRRPSRAEQRQSGECDQAECVLSYLGPCSEHR